MPGEINYTGKTNGELGVGLQNGLVWNTTSSSWVSAEPEAPVAGEAGYEGLTNGETGVGLQAGSYWYQGAWRSLTPGNPTYLGQSEGEIGVGAQAGQYWYKDYPWMPGRWETIPESAPVAGEDGYLGQMEGEAGIGAQDGLIWSWNSGGVWVLAGEYVAPVEDIVPDGNYLGQSHPNITDLWWNEAGSNWAGTDFLNDYSFYEGMENGELGAGALLDGLYWDSSYPGWTLENPLA